ncbi:MAG: hypothetical protein GEV08_13060 [Acidimicrobiia bacterium]|nr:hypothetical protein [Acidimicrobiia bacterium]
MDGDDRQLRPGHPRQAPPGHVRRGVRRRPRRGAGRRLQPDRRGHSHGRRVPGHGALVIRQWLPARRLVHRPLHGRRRPHAAAAHDGAARGRGGGPRHLVGSGLCGTGSHDYTVDGVLVPDERTFSAFGEGGVEGPLGNIPELSYSSIAFAHVALGIADGALAEVTTLATGKVPMFADATLAANPLFRHQLGEADAHLRAAAALLEATVASTWATAVDGEFAPEQLARARAAATWATKAAAEVVDTAYTAGGGTALYCSSPLQRRLRDAHAVTQHFALKGDTFTLAGAVLAGQDVDLSFL